MVKFRIGKILVAVFIVVIATMLTVIQTQAGPPDVRIGKKIQKGTQQAGGQDLYFAFFPDGSPDYWFCYDVPIDCLVPSDGIDT
jgi:hypothetical protein